MRSSGYTPTQARHEIRRRLPQSLAYDPDAWESMVPFPNKERGLRLLFAGTVLAGLMSFGSASGWLHLVASVAGQVIAASLIAVGLICDVRAWRDPAGTIRLYRRLAIVGPGHRTAEQELVYEAVGISKQLRALVARVALGGPAVLAPTTEAADQVDRIIWWMAEASVQPRDGTFAAVASTVEGLRAVLVDAATLNGEVQRGPVAGRALTEAASLKDRVAALANGANQSGIGPASLSDPLPRGRLR